MLVWSRLRERVAIDVLRWTPKGTLSRGIGWLARRRVPRPLRRPIYGGFARYAGADLSALDRPIEAFERFDDFFTRPLAPGARPVEAGSDGVVSPVDGVISEVGRADGGRMIQCKGLDYTVRGLLADAEEARQFEGGAYVTIYLAPRDYHRIHSPVAGRVIGYRHIPGAFFPVNPLSVRNVAGLFSINERMVTYLDSDAGKVAVVKVAATGVGHITLSYDRQVHSHRRGAAGRHGWTQSYAPPRPIGAAEELARFHLGSTVILLFQPGRVELEAHRGDVVRVGRRIGRRLSIGQSRTAPVSSGRIN
ncbi:MAG: archaetidylserine decarboxylase [Polyangia bacterium]|jgi:phosphatidylserine decarboxylase